MAAFLWDTAGKPFVWGKHDCGLWLADWLFKVRGTRTAEDLRGQYCDATSLRAVSGTGSVAIIIGRLARRAGLERVADLNAGDVGVISLARTHAVGAIRGRAGWYVLAVGGGLSFVRNARVIAAWAI